MKNLLLFSAILFIGLTTFSRPLLTFQNDGTVELSPGYDHGLNVVDNDGFPELTQTTMYLDIDKYLVPVQSFNGANEYNYYGPLDVAAWNSFYASVWFKSSGTPDHGDRIVSMIHSGSNDLRIWWVTGGYIKTSLADGSTTEVSTTQTYADSEWHYLETYLTGSTLTLKVDDETVTGTADFDFAGADGSIALSAKADAYGNKSAGYLSAFCFGESKTNLHILDKMEAESGTAAIDDSGKGNSGVAINPDRVFSDGFTGWNHEAYKDYSYDSVLMSFDAGSFDFSWDGPNPFWVFPNGQTSQASRPSRSITAGNVRLSVPSWSGNYTLDGHASTICTIDLSQLPPLTYSLTLAVSPGLTGDLSDLPDLTHKLDLYQSVNITGDLSDLPPLSYYLDLAELPLITGDISDLPPISYQMSIRDCSLVTGALSNMPPVSHYLNLGNLHLITGDLTDLPVAPDYFFGIDECYNITGAVTNFPDVTWQLGFNNCTNITGTFAQLPRVTYLLSCANNLNLTGTVADLPPVTSTLNLNGCANITGSLADLPAVGSFLGLRGCANLTGIMPASCKPTTIDLRDTGLSQTDLEQCLIVTDTGGKTSGSFKADDGMPTITDSAAVAAIASLRGKGWTVEVNE